MPDILPVTIALGQVDMSKALTDKLATRRPMTEGPYKASTVRRMLVEEAIQK